VIDIIRVRSATAADAATIARFQQDMHRERGAPEEPRFVDRFSEFWLASPERRPAWLAERDGNVTGVLVLVVIDMLPCPGQVPESWAHVSLVFVTHDARNTGVGRLLLGEMLSWAAANRVSRVQLNTNNPNAARLYRKVGFAPAPARLMELRI
jgi:GNAT superfamily N-acetyltransferase